MKPETKASEAGQGEDADEGLMIGEKILGMIDFAITRRELDPMDMSLSTNSSFLI